MDATPNQAETQGKTQGASEGIKVSMPGPVGMHARPAGRLLKLSKGFDAALIIKNEQGKEAPIRSIAKVLSMGITSGETLYLHATGPEASKLLEAAKAAFDEGLGEENAPSEHISSGGIKRKILTTYTPQSFESRFDGVVAAKGYGMGNVHVFVDEKPQAPRSESLGEALELSELERALEYANKSLQSSLDTMPQDDARYGIFEVHQALLGDEEIIDAAKGYLKRNYTAFEAWQKACDESAEKLRNHVGEVFAQRAADIDDIKTRVLFVLSGKAESNSLALLPPKTILIAEDLTPSQTAQLKPENIVALCTSGGGATSHTAIIAKNLGIGAIVGLGASVLTIQSGTEALVDAYQGSIYLTPSQDDIQKAQDFTKTLSDIEASYWQRRMEACKLKDGTRIEVAANVRGIEDSQNSLESGAEAIGLVRTEFLFLGKNMPSEEEQYQTYKAILESMNGKPVIFRTLDIGADKKVPYLELTPETNPMLGIRGIRLSLRNEKTLFEPQMRALLRASTHGMLRIMFPMITQVHEIRFARSAVRTMCKEMGIAEPKVGIMIEVPSAVFMAEDLAKEVDFFSVGTNDLTSYTLAMDRLNPDLSKEVDALNPAVLRAIAQTCEAAKKSDIWVGVCGGIASDVDGALLLVGLGVKELSMDNVSIPAIKATLAEHTMPSLKNMATEALKMISSDDVRAFIGGKS